MPSNREIVVAYLDALAGGPNSLPAARELLVDDLEYHDPLMAAASADELIDRLREVDTAGAPTPEPFSKDNRPSSKGAPMATKPDDVPAELIERYRAAIATQPDIELRGGGKLPHASTNGYVFSSLTKDGRMGHPLVNGRQGGVHGST